jgi:hypothetical protein
VRVQDWELFARDAARDACENHFPSRRGVWYYEDLDVLVIYNNNPYAAGPQYREAETAEIRELLRAAGIKELAYATYPPAGEKDAGYTYALVLDCSIDRQEDVADIIDTALRHSRERM